MRANGFSSDTNLDSLADRAAALLDAQRAAGRPLPFAVQFYGADQARFLAFQKARKRRGLGEKLRRALGRIAPR